jgi:hypothetical protein
MSPQPAAGIDVTLRAALPDDSPRILDLVGSVMGWGGDENAASIWRWKHVDNPAGPSPTWVAEDASGRIVGVRTFLRWRFVSPGGPRSAVRAVDTVTHPDMRGRGLFRSLTMLGLEELAGQGVDFVFNTPNDQSRPGYLSMGWRPVRKLGVSVRPRGLTGSVRMARNRLPADLKSLPIGAGRPASEGLDDATCGVFADAPRHGLTTMRDAAYLRWRYAGLPALAYRVVTLSSDPAEGVAVVRLRRRGCAREATVAELFAPSPLAALRLSTRVVRGSGADYTLTMPVVGTPFGPGIPVPRLGPLLVARRVGSDPPEAAEWRLSLGDVELF